MTDLLFERSNSANNPLLLIVKITIKLMMLLFLVATTMMLTQSVTNNLPTATNNNPRLKHQTATTGNNVVHAAAGAVNRKRQSGNNSSHLDYTSTSTAVIVRVFHDHVVNNNLSDEPVFSFLKFCRNVRDMVPRSMTHQFKVVFIYNTDKEVQLLRRMTCAQFAPNCVNQSQSNDANDVTYFDSDSDYESNSPSSSSFEEEEDWRGEPFNDTKILHPVLHRGSATLTTESSLDLVCVLVFSTHTKDDVTSSTLRGRSSSEGGASNVCRGGSGGSNCIRSSSNVPPFSSSSLSHSAVFDLHSTLPAGIALHSYLAETFHDFASTNQYLKAITADLDIFTRLKSADFSENNSLSATLFNKLLDESKSNFFIKHYNSLNLLLDHRC